MPSLSETRSARRLQVVQGYRIFAALGWGDLGDGHISARDPIQSDCFWVLDTDCAFRDANVDALVLLNGCGEIVEGNGNRNDPAFYIHNPILQARPDVVSVAHTHTFYGTPYSATAQKFQAITQEACIFVDDHALFDDEEVQVQDEACGKRIAATLGKNRGVILRNHGLLTVGTEVSQTIAWFVLMERVAEAHIKAIDPIPISHNAAMYAKADLATDEQGRHAFKNLVAHHL